ncbi:MAG TPA: ShlB/FhaC/HecB family hemolysin secretion/activation protein [Sphingomonas sp.]|nr:ShlB/FhaC/HecB family hemolysin secretion/activation protein [Sphingomonas sp.]
MAVAAIQEAIPDSAQPAPAGPANANQQVERAPDRFPVYAIDVLGVTKLPAGEVERLIYPYLGPDKSGPDIEAARAAIQKAYTDRGYEAVVVEIPAQTTERFAQGIVELRVSEAPVGQVRVVENKYHSAGGVRSQVPSVREGQPLNLQALQRDIEVANQFPDRQVTPSFKPGTEPGTIDVDLTVQDKFPLHSSVELNNDNSPSTERLRLVGNTRYTDVWGLGHTASIGFVLSPEDRHQSSVISGSYLAPLQGTPWSVLVYGYRSNSNIAALGGTNVLGNGYQIGLRAIYRVPSRDSVQSVSFGPDYKSFKQDILVGIVNAASTPIRYVPLTLEYNFASTDDESAFAKAFGPSSFDATFGTTFGVRAIKRVICFDHDNDPRTPCLPVDQFQNREVDSFENFVHFNAGFNYSLATKNDFILATRASMQLADSHLVTNEQFSAGGISSVRGYLQSEAVGDDGYVSGLELQSPSLGPEVGPWLSDLRFYGFVDSGVVRIRRAQPGQRSRYSLIGAGAGFRIRLLDKLSGEMVLAIPLTDGLQTQKGDTRTVFVVRGEF